MPDLSKINEAFSLAIERKNACVYLVGIGGIGMSALARFFKSRQFRVSGYDKTPTALTRELEAEGISVHYEEDPEKIPKRADLVIYTPAIPEDHSELVFYRQHGYQVMKRSEVLQMITAGSFNVCVAGTHGKTTITTMIAHILRDSGFGCNAFLGGIAVNYGTNFWSSAKNIIVVEADEYDRSFLKLAPDIAVITAMDADHLDIYGTAEAMEQAFVDFSHRVKPGGLLVRQFGLKRGRELGGTQLTYSLQNEAADVFASGIRMEKGSYYFDAHINGERVENLVLHMGGMHNVENAIAALAVASSLKIAPEKMRSALASFEGVKRRFEYVIRNQRLVMIDDYAHHPEELRALIGSVRTLFRQRRCTVVFQPHLYSRTRDLAGEFAAALDLADEVILLPIYPAREQPIPGVSSEMILDRLQREKKQVLDGEKVLTWTRDSYLPGIDREFGEVLVIAGAGDIDLLVEPMKKILIQA